MWIMPQLAVEKLMQTGLKEIRNNPDLLDEVFEYMSIDDMTDDYGEDYIEKIKAWFLETKIPVIHAWSFNIDRVPCLSIHLAVEQEDESKGAVGDYSGQSDDADVGVAVFSCQIDIGIHASKTGDQVLWLYYIVSYVLFRNKRLAERMGLQLHTYGTSDWDKRPEYLTENIWTRWLKLRCTTENTWSIKTLEEYEVETDVDVESSSNLGFIVDT